MNVDENQPVYPMGVAADLLNVHPRTLRIYEAEGLVKPHRFGGKRLFSKNDLKWIECLRILIHEENLSIPGIKKLLEYAPCWKLKNCPPEIRDKCTVERCKQRNCWEMAQKTCQKSCRHCNVYKSRNINPEQ